MSKVLREASDWVGRTIAAMLAIALPGLAGHWLDEYFDVRFLTPIGIIGGMVLSTTALVMLVQSKGSLQVSVGARKRGNQAAEDASELRQERTPSDDRQDQQE